MKMSKNKTESAATAEKSGRSGKQSAANSLPSLAQHAIDAREIQLLKSSSKLGAGQTPALIIHMQSTWGALDVGEG